MKIANVCCDYRCGRCLKTGRPRQRASLGALGADFPILSANLALADGLVLVMRADGQLAANETLAGFARHYGDAARDGGTDLVLFQAEPRNEEIAAPVPITSPPEIFAAIDETAMRYGSHCRQTAARPHRNTPAA